MSKGLCVCCNIKLPAWGEFLSKKKVDPKPWETDEDGLLVYQDPEIEKIIKSNHLKLRRSLQLSEAFWAAAVEEDLISNSAINNIKDKSDFKDQNSALLDFILRSPVYIFHRVLRCLVISEQHAIVRDLGFNVKDYMPKNYKCKSPLNCPVCHETYTSVAILPCCGSYICKDCLECPEYAMNTNCPIPACERPLQEGEVFHDDPPFLHVVRVLSGCLREESCFTRCQVCSQDCTSLRVTHSCRECQGEVCSNCLMKHADDPRFLGKHAIQHLHQLTLCCLHNRRTVGSCRKCSVYICVECRDTRCRKHSIDNLRRHHRPSSSFDLEKELYQRTQDSGEEIARLREHILEVNDVHKSFLENVSGVQLTPEGRDWAQEKSLLLVQLETEVKIQLYRMLKHQTLDQYLYHLLTSAPCLQETVAPSLVTAIQQLDACHISLKDLLTEIKDGSCWGKSLRAQEEHEVRYSVDPTSTASRGKVQLRLQKSSLGNVPGLRSSQPGLVKDDGWKDGGHTTLLLEDRRCSLPCRLKGTSPSGYEALIPDCEPDYSDIGVPEHLPSELRAQVSEFWIPANSLTFEKRLVSSGSYGHLQLRTWVKDGKPWKHVVTRAIPETNCRDMKTFIKTIVRTKSFKHENILTPIALTFPKKFISVMVSLMNGDLRSFLLNRRCSPNQLLNFLLDVARGMKYLEKKDFIHGNLAAKNIMLTERGQACVSGLGLRVDLFTPQYSHHPYIRWMSPEYFNTQTCSLKTDLWSFGVTGWEIMTHCKIPYPNVKNDDHIKRLITEGNITRMEDCPHHMYNQVLVKCWHHDPEKRPSFDVILQDLTPLLKSTSKREPRQDGVANVSTLL